MADERLRALERARRSDPEGRARRVRERLRAGLLDGGRLGLAALLGDEIARAVLGGAAPGAVQVLDDLIEAVTLADAAVQVRVGAAAAREALAARAGEIAPPELERAGAAVDAAEAWLGCPCEAHRADAACHWLGHLDRRPLSPEVEAQMVAFLAAQVAGGGPSTRAGSLERLLRHAARALEVDGEALAARLALRLVPWALGEAAPG